MSLTIPYKFKPRDYQLPFLEAMDKGFRRAVCVWHRRAGKDKTFLNFVIKKMFERVGTYYYYFPTQTMGRKILWDGMDKDGFPFLDHFPKEVVSSRNNQEMKIKLRNGSVFQIIGTDRLDVVGTNPVGCVFSEYSLQNPHAWAFVRPILAENDGWAVFNYTPRGDNHGKELLDMAESNDEWFTSVLTVDDTKAISQKAIDEERESGMVEELIQQEFYCSFDMGVVGAYYALKLAEMRRRGQIGKVVYDKSKDVYLVCDIGFDGTPIIFFQMDGNTPKIIDYYSNSNQPLDHYIEVLDLKKKEMDYRYSTLFMPHDANKREMQTNNTNADYLREKGFDVQCMEREKNVDTGINRTLYMLHRTLIDSERCEALIIALKNYKQKYNDQLKCYMGIPEHDWASHPADALRYMSKAVDEFDFGVYDSISVDAYRELKRKYA